MKKKSASNKKLDKQIKELNKHVKELSRTSSKKVKKLKDYEPLAVTLFAFLIIFSGLTVSILEKNSAPTGFVVIDTTVNTIYPYMEAGNSECIEDWFCTEWKECKEPGINKRECLDFNGCKTEYAKPSETMECDIAYVASPPRNMENNEEIIEIPLTGYATSTIEKITSDMLLLLIYIISILSIAIIASYAYFAYIHKTALHHSLPAVAYWLAMAGIPLSIYFTSTRGQYLVPVYVALGMVIASFFTLMILKPWAPKGFPEMQHLDLLLEEVSENAASRFTKIRNGRIGRQKAFDNFRNKVNVWNTERELRLLGAKETKLRGIDKDLQKIVKKGPEIRIEVVEIENDIREREAKFASMEKNLAKWAEKKKREKEAREKEQMEIKKEKKAAERKKRAAEKIAMKKMEAASKAARIGGKQDEK